jgi:Asp/Glu/hydantoin racemase
MVIKGGKQYYGEAIGIALFDGRRYPILPGDVANASTYDYPVRLKVIEGLFDTPTPWDKNRAVPADIQKIIDAVKSLEDDGVRAVVTACGFFSVVQEMLADAVNIPVFTSPLMMVPQIVRMIRSDRSVCIITASERLLVSDYLTAVGIASDMPVHIVGMEASTEFYATHMGGTQTTLDVDLQTRELVEIARNAVIQFPDIGALLLECSQLPTFAADIQDVVNLPVFDYIGFIDMIYCSVVQRRYTGIL